MRSPTLAQEGNLDQTCREQDKRGLLVRAQEGDPLACREIVEKYTRLVWYWVQKMFSSSASVEDGCQEVWLRFARALPTLHIDSVVPSYLKTVTQNAAIDYSRSRQRKLDLTTHMSEIQGADGEFDIPVLSEDSLAEMQRSDLQILLCKEAEAVLDAMELEVFHLVYLQELPRADVAEILKISTRTVTRKCVLILEKLRQSSDLARTAADMWCE